MAKIDLARRAEIGRERRERTRSQIVEAAALLLAERPLGAVTVDGVVEAAGVAKGTFYYHFQGLDELAAAVGAKLAESFDELLTPTMREMRDPIERLSFAFAKFLDKAIADPPWARLVVQSSQTLAEFGSGLRAHLRADVAQAIAERRVSIEDVDLAADIVIGIWLQITRGTLERRPVANLAGQAIPAVLRALGVAQ
ncbi:MAG: helix-turn-helix domain-containing protein [Parvularculaceae bacterium]